jgi:hypothetical protein
VNSIPSEVKFVFIGKHAGKHAASMGKMRNAYRVRPKQLKRKHHLEGFGTDERTLKANINET